MKRLQLISFVLFVLIVLVGGVCKMAHPNNTKANKWDYKLELNRDYTITIKNQYNKVDTLQDITKLETYIINQNT